MGTGYEPIDETQEQLLEAIEILEAVCNTGPDDAEGHKRCWYMAQRFFRRHEFPTVLDIIDDAGLSP